MRKAKIIYDGNALYEKFLKKGDELPRVSVEFADNGDGEYVMCLSNGQVSRVIDDISLLEITVTKEPEVIWVNKCNSDIEVFKFPTKAAAQKYVEDQPGHSWDYIAKKFIEVIE